MTSNTNREEDDEEQYEELTRSEGGMPSGTGGHELEKESVDPGYGDGDSLINSSGDSDSGSDEE